MTSLRSHGSCPRCGASLPHDDLQGRCPRCLIDQLFSDANELEEDLIRTEPALRRIGNFELLEELARGGMGVVYRARQVGLDRTVAVKLMGDARLGSAQLVERFRAEAAAAARLKHPRIVAIHEFGCDQGEYYFAMDLVDGPNLAEATTAGPLPVERAARLTVMVAEAVQHAHERGLIHRDLKPSNVILDSEGLPHVTDFGLAYPLDAASSLTATGQVLGTPGYMAPEQVETHAIVGPATDVYGLGSLLYHLLTGRPPFVGSGLPAILSQVLHFEPASPGLLNPAVPEDLAAVCLKCLQKRPVDRYPSAEHARQDLERFLNGEPTLARPAGYPERLARWARRQPALAAAIAAIGLVLLLGLAGTTWQWRKAQSSLFQTQILAAHGRRQSGEIGQKNDALKLIAAVAPMRPSSELRTEAAAALAKLDLTIVPGEWSAKPDMEFRVTPPTYAVSPDGTEVANWQMSGPNEGAVWIESLNRSHPPYRFNHDGRSGDELAFSPDGCFLAVRYFRDSEVRLWDFWRRTPLWHTSIPKNTDFTLEFSPDSAHLAISADPKVHLLRTSDGNESAIVAPEGLKDPIRRVRFSPNGQRLAIAAGSEMIVWDLAAKAILSREAFTDRPTSALAWHPDNRRIALAVWQRPGIFICDANYSPGRQFIDSGGSLVFQLMFSPSGDLLVGRTTDGRTRIWETATWQPVLSTEAGLASRFVGSGDHLAFDRSTGSVGIWSLDRSRVFRAFGGYGAPRPLRTPAFSADGKFVFWCAQLGICRGNLDTGQTEDFFAPGIVALQVNPGDGLLLTAGEAGLQRRGWTENSTTLAEEPLTALESSADGTMLVGLARDHLLLLGTTRRILPLGALQEPASLAIDPNGRWAFVGSTISGSAVIDLADGKTLYVTDESSCNGSFDRAGKWLVVASPRHYSILATADWLRLRSWKRETPGSSLTAVSNPVAISPDGRILATALVPRLISLLERETGTELVRLEAPVSLAIGSLAFSPDGSRLAATSAIGTVQIWELTTLRSELARFDLNWDD